MKTKLLKQSFLTLGPEAEPGEKTLESVPPPGRWDPVPQSTGHKKPVAPNEDEDDEG